MSMHGKHKLNAVPLTALISICVASAALGCTFQASTPQQEDTERIESFIAEVYPGLEQIYKHLHAHPELSLQEKETSALVAREFRSAGYEVTENVGGYGVVGVLRNGEGPTVLIRGDMDALPITEKTGLPFASTVRATDHLGREVGVMHACGHDIHTTVLIGNAKVLARLKDRWRGTLVMVAQPAEEGFGGAGMMLDSGLYEKFPRPDYALALHVTPKLPVGSIGYRPGQALAGTLSTRLKVRGLGGHSSAPQDAKDPVVLAARIILTLQTVVSREIDPREPAVLSICEVHGGTAANIIPTEVELTLNLRFASDAVKDQMLEVIDRICRGEAMAAGLPQDLWPELDKSVAANPPVYNDPELAERVAAVFRKTLGDDNVVEVPLFMGSEDFALFRHGDPPVPIFLFWLGINDPEFLRQLAGKDMRDLDERSAGRLALHTPYIFAVHEPAIKTGVLAVCSSLLVLMRTNEE